MGDEGRKGGEEEEAERRCSWIAVEVTTRTKGKGRSLSRYCDHRQRTRGDGEQTAGHEWNARRGQDQ